MSEGILVALIGLGGSGIGSLAGVLVSSRLTQYRLEQLEKKVQAHNGLVERTFRLEAQAQAQAEQLKTADRRLGELEKSARRG